MIEVGQLDRMTAARYMGMKPEDVNEVMMDLFDQAEELIQRDAKVAYVCDIEDIKKTEKGIAVDGTSLVLPGRDMEKLLSDCEKVVVMCATISGNIDTRIRSLQVSNMPLALVYDACASVAVDQVCDEIQKYVSTQLPEYVQTMRFSPGYGDLPIELQPEILNVLDAGKRAGVSLTAGGMMVPVKSVTAVFGLKPLSAALSGQVSAYIQDGPKCGDESVCSRCKAGAACKMRNVKK